MVTHNDSSYVHPITEYSNLESYNQSTTMSFLRYKNVPSSNFPVLPVVETKMSNNVLTYDTDMNYPNRKKSIWVHQRTNVLCRKMSIQPICT